MKVNSESKVNRISCGDTWNPDDQCDHIYWRSDSLGQAAANWIMGPNAGDQVLVVSVIGRSDGPSPPLPFTFTGTATDLPAHAVLPWVLNLSSRQNKGTLTAKSTTSLNKIQC